MTRILLKAWAILLLLPTLPVIGLYLFFGSENYFHLTDTSKGIVAAGPIAAYVVLVGIGWTIYSRLSKITTSEPANLDRIVGEWNFESQSSRDPEDIRQGACSILKKRGALKISGNFLENENSVATWESDMYKLDESRLRFSYELNEVKEGIAESSNGICLLTFGGQQISTMSGIWILVGKENAAGSITFTRI